MSNSAQKILGMAAETIGTRAIERDRTEGERSMARTVAAFNALTGKNLTEVEGWLFMVALKAARSTGGRHRLDDYIDLCGYGGLLAECADQQFGGGE